MQAFPILFFFTSQTPLVLSQALKETACSSLCLPIFILSGLHSSSPMELPSPTHLFIPDPDSNKHSLKASLASKSGLHFSLLLSKSSPLVSYPVLKEIMFLQCLMSPYQNQPRVKQFSTEFLKVFQRRLNAITLQNIPQNKNRRNTAQFVI